MTGLSVPDNVERDTANATGAPPALVFRPVRGYVAKISLGCLIAFAGLAWMMAQGALVSWVLVVSVAALALACLAAPLAVARLQLVLHPAGIAWRTPLGVTTVPWSGAVIRLVAPPRHVEISGARCTVRRWWTAGETVGGRTIRLSGDWFGLTTEGLAAAIARYREQLSQAPR